MPLIRTTTYRLRCELCNKTSDSLQAEEFFNPKALKERLPGWGVDTLKTEKGYRALCFCPACSGIQRRDRINQAIVKHKTV